MSVESTNPLLFHLQGVRNELFPCPTTSSTSCMLSDRIANKAQQCSTESQIYSTSNGGCYFPIVPDAIDTSGQQLKYFRRRRNLVNDATYAKIRKYQVDDFTINRNEFYITFTKYAMYLTCFMLIILALMILRIVPTFIAILLLFIVVVSYMFVFYLETKKNMIRRPYDYSKIYWDIGFGDKGVSM